MPDGNCDARTWMRCCVHGYGDVITWMRSCVHGYSDVRTLRLTPARTGPAVGERRTPRPCCSGSPLPGHWTPPWCPCTPPHSSWSSGTPSCLFGILHFLLFKNTSVTQANLWRCMKKKWKRSNSFSLHLLKLYLLKKKGKMMIKTTTTQSTLFINSTHYHFLSVQEVHLFITYM